MVRCSSSSWLRRDVYVCDRLISSQILCRTDSRLQQGSKVTVERPGTMSTTHQVKSNLLFYKMNRSHTMIITASAASRTAPLSSKSASCPKMIHLPQTNITLEKLPPLELSSVEMPHGSPKTTLYKVLNSISGRVSVPIYM